MKKKILFVLIDFSSGGAQKSLISLLNEFDYDRYDVEVMAFCNEGLFQKRIPDQVKIVKGAPILQEIYARKSIKNILKRKVHLHTLFRRYQISRAIKKCDKKYRINDKNRAQVTWKYWESHIPVFEKEYDVAISYIQGTPLYYMMDKIHAKKKIGWIHTDNRSSGMIAEIDYPYFKRLDYIVTVSDACKVSLEKDFSEFSNKIIVIENIISRKEIITLANHITEKLPRKNGEINLLSIGRLSKEKGFDMAVQVLDRLRKEHYQVNWFVVGKGSEEKKLRTMIKEKGLENNFILLGEQENPYQYLMQCDIYVQPSRFEGKVIAVEEAKIFNVPIVVTAYPTVKEQIIDGENGLVASITADGILKKLKELIDNKKLYQNIKKVQEKTQYDNSSEVKKLYRLIEGEAM